MILLWLLIFMLAGALLAWLISIWSDTACRLVSLAALLVDLALLLILWGRYYNQISLSAGGPWLVQMRLEWIPQAGVSFYLAADGLSLLLLILTVFLGIMSVAASWNDVKERVGFFHFNLLLTLAGIIGVFTSLDLFLFYFFWELMLVPMYFLISIWGHEKRVRAALKFFIFTQSSGLLMLLSILGLYFIHGRSTGAYVFDYLQLLDTPVAKPTATWLMLGFAAAFAVKLPVVPVHVWLPDAHTEAPTAGSVILSGLMLKTGAYGFIRFMIPLFPDAARGFVTVAMILAVVGILYGAVLAFAQSDLKRLVAYTSISHMGFVLLGVFSWNQVALQGVVVIILAHGLSTSALFIMVGALQERIHTRELDRMGGLWSVVPRLGGVGMFLAAASLGLPGLANFVGEFLVLVGTFQVSPSFGAIAAAGLITSVIYSLWMIQRTFFGTNLRGWQVPDLGMREMSVFGLMIAALVWLGTYPQPVLNMARPALDALRRTAAPFEQVNSPENRHRNPSSRAAADSDSGKAGDG